MRLVREVSPASPVTRYVLEITDGDLMRTRLTRVDRQLMRLQESDHSIAGRLYLLVLMAEAVEQREPLDA